MLPTIFDIIVLVISIILLIFSIILNLFVWKVEQIYKWKEEENEKNNSAAASDPGDPG